MKKIKGNSHESIYREKIYISVSYKVLTLDSSPGRVRKNTHSSPNFDRYVSLEKSQSLDSIFTYLSL